MKKKKTTVKRIKLLHRAHGSFEQILEGGFVVLKLLNYDFTS